MKSQKDKGPRRILAAVYLKAVPHRNHSMEIQRRDHGGCLVSVPLKRPGYLVPPLSWILPFSSHRRVELDSLGAQVLDLCDGKNTVETVIEKFAVTHKLSFRESQLAVTQFLRQLTQRGLVVVVGPEKDSA